MQREDGIELYIESQVDIWNDDATKVHGISYTDMLTFPSKKQAWDSIVNFLGDDTDIELIVYANPQTQLGWLLFDVVLFKYGLMNHLGLERENHLKWNISGYSVHSLAKECHKEGLFEAIKNLDSNRYSFKQRDVYMALFGANYDEHEAKADCLAMKRIYNYLMQLKKSNTVQSGQQTLL